MLRALMMSSNLGLYGQQTIPSLLTTPSNIHADRPSRSRPGPLPIDDLLVGSARNLEGTGCRGDGERPFYIFIDFLKEITW